jgi:probable F420-dependent oxidoreductase
MPVRIGLQVQPQHATFEQMREAWREADALGVDTIFTWDHFFPLYGDPDGAHFECLTTLASMAEVTERAQIGALVVCNSYRNPELLADAHRTIDHISGGREILGIGAGWFEKDYDEYGYAFGTAPDRLRSLSAALPRIRSRLSKLNPPPVGDMPILIGGSGPKVTLRLVAEHAQMWHGFGDVANYREKAEILAGHCERIGRDPAEIEHTRGVHRNLLEQVDDLHAAGVGHLILGVGGGPKGYDLRELHELVAWRERVNAGG